MHYMIAVSLEMSDEPKVFEIIQVIRHWYLIQCGLH